MQLTDFKVEAISGIAVRIFQIKTGENISAWTYLNTKKQHYQDDKYCFEAIKFKLGKFNGY